MTKEERTAIFNERFELLCKVRKMWKRANDNGTDFTKEQCAKIDELFSKADALTELLKADDQEKDAC